MSEKVNAPEISVKNVSMVFSDSKGNPVQALKVKERGKQLGALLEDIKAKHKSVGDVRYIGLFSCVELTKDKATHEPLVPFGKDPEGIMGKIVGMLKAKGFNTYSHEACIFVCPPLIITEEELAENMAILDEVLTEADKMV